MILGVQLSFRTKLLEIVKEAETLGCNTIQFFSHNPRQWRSSFNLEEEEIKKFKFQLRIAKIEPLFIHLPYLINIASPDEKLYQRSIKAFIEAIKEADKLGANFLITHMGSHRKAGERFGLNRIVSALDTILDKTYDSSIVILLENTSGSGSWLGYSFSHHGFILRKVKNKRRLGLCLDTCHAYVAGYDISKEEGLKILFKEIKEEVGIDRLRLVHLNDAKDRCGSLRDRHADIAKGYIGIEGMQAIINHPYLKRIPFILETPKKTDRDDIRNLNMVKSLRYESE
ncbi:MAG: deoxyribonuclease IV [Candidatus Omnitrophica bacterium]|nr:deoxyribonuclease IV [Candidatus Omnitrophota bacterium]MCM8800082.1 deoxyribonuclease IV [Candidatus Omnitrophota bacterium]